MSFIRHEINSSISHLIGNDDGNDDDSDAQDNALSEDDDDNNDDDDDLIGDGAGLLEGTMDIYAVDDYQKITDSEDAENDSNNNNNNDNAAAGAESDSDAQRFKSLAMYDENGTLIVPRGALATTYSKDLKILDHVRRSLPSYDGNAILAPPKKRKTFNSRYNITAPLDRIRGPIYGQDDWIQNRNAASLAYDENARAKQTILKLVIPNSNPTPPPRGRRQIVVPPNSLTDVRFEEWMMLTTPELYTINVVSTFHLGSPISLHSLAQRLLGVAYSPLSFSALKLRNTLATFMIFLSGRVVCAGANSRMSSFIAAQSVVNLLKRCDIMAECLEFSEQNAVATATAGFNINLVELARAYPIHVYFEPKCFPGAMVRPMSSQLTYIVFKGNKKKENDECDTGAKIIITGVASRLDSLVAMRWIHSYMLWQFELQTEKFYYNEADYSRKEKQNDSIIESVCESICEVTQSCIASVIDKNISTSSSSSTSSTSSTSTPLQQQKSVLETIYAEHVDPINKTPCILVPDDDDPSNTPVTRALVKKERVAKSEHPALKNAHPYFRRVVALCESIGSSSTSASAAKALAPEVIDVEKWLEEDEKIYGTVLDGLKEINKKPNT